ncbi:poly(glycerol-phosphate) alpha-glucosyltransferase, partial [Staphylococcus hominis]
MGIENNIKNLIEEINSKESIEGYVFIRLGKPSIKAQVKLLKKTNYLEREINKLCQKFKKKAGELPTWIKVDIVTNYEYI